MTMVAPESTSIAPLLANLGGVTVLIACYVFGVWLRSYVYPADSDTPLRRQLLAAIPIGLVTMGIYAKTSLAHVDFANGGVYDFVTMLGYAVILGMLSRESLEKMLETAGRRTAVPSAPPQALPQALGPEDG